MAIFGLFLSVVVPSATGRPAETGNSRWSKVPLTYRDSGVNIDAGNSLVERIRPFATTTRRRGTLEGLGGFAGQFDVAAAGFDDPILVAATDGVGTKLRIAIESDCHDFIGIDLVAMCVNDLVCSGATPLFFLDYLAMGRLQVDVATRIIAGIAAGCREAGCALLGGESAEMPGLYQGSDYDLAGFAVGAVEREQRLPRAVEPDDLLLGFPSDGLHSNGFSLVRRVLAERGLTWSDDIPFGRDETANESEAVKESGAVHHTGQPFTHVLLRPTRIYVEPVQRALATGCLKALAHITGGGLSENVPRALPENLGAVIDLDAWRFPTIFNWIADAGDVNGPEMLRTFNCGIGMVAVTAPSAWPRIRDAVSMTGIQPIRIGRVCREPGVRYLGSWP